MLKSTGDKIYQFLTESQMPHKGVADFFNVSVAEVDQIVKDRQPVIVPVTINKNLVNNALVHIFDSLNGDDDDTRFEVTIVEDYMNQQALQIELMQTKLNDAAEVAMYNHYFTEEVIKQLSDCTGDLFGIGEDCFVMELYPFAELILKHSYAASEAGAEFNGVFVYEAMEELAGLWVATVMRQSLKVGVNMIYEMPELDEYELDVVRVVASHTQ